MSNIRVNLDYIIIMKDGETRTLVGKYLGIPNGNIVNVVPIPDK